MFIKIHNIHRKTPLLESLFNKVAGLQDYNFSKRRFQQRCFPVNIVKNFENSFLYRGTPLTAFEFAKSLFTYCLRIHELYLKTRPALQISSHEARPKMPVRQLFLSTLTGLRTHVHNRCSISLN